MSDGSIAIVGASCRFPGAADLEAYWQLLVSGTDAITKVDQQRWSTRRFYHPQHGEPGKSYTWAAGLLTGVDLFDPAFFGISPREAAQMDPQQRLLLELVWHAAEDAGISAAKLAGSAAGVFIGASSTDYRDIRVGDPSGSDGYSMTGGTLSILANRVSYVFDLRGPSFTVDTACSSSLVALHQACEAIRAGHIPAAIVGGINVLLSPFSFIGFCRASMLSERGHCFAFDERADGYVRSEGGGVIILKPLAQAVADGDAIRAVIRGTGVNSDGRTIGLSLPSEAAQAELLRSLYARAGVAPDDLAFFEMHGTGTPAGDPIEAAAVGGALGRGRQTPLPIGSVKSNLGHLEPASGMAGLIKAALALDRGTIPATLNCETPNPRIPFAELNLRLLHQAEPLGTADRCFAGVNSFGFGGTNGHAILAPPPRAAAASEPVAAEPGGPLPPLVISARSEAALRALAAEWRTGLAAAPAEAVPARLRAAARLRDHHAHRLVAFGDAPEAIAATLDDFLAGPAPSAAISGTAVRGGGLAFAFSGNGAQFPGMGREAYRASPAFREAIAEIDALLQPMLGWSAAGLIDEGIDAARLARADYAQPLLFAIQVGIVTVLRRLGIEASGHIGHSVGEVAAGWSAGALTLPDATRVIVARSRHQEQTRGIGRMAALALGAEATRDLLAELGSPLEIGALNATQSVTVSGPATAIEQLRTEARRRGIGCRPLDLEFAFHSDAMDPIRDGLRADLSGLRSQAPAGLLVSTVTGEPVEAGMLGADYWWQNVRNPVQFADGMAGLVAAGHRIFVEIGANPVLQSYLHDALRTGEAQGRVLGTLNRRDAAGDPFPAIAARCHVSGYDIAKAPWFDGAAERRGLPLYPWQRERFWFEPTTEGPDLINPQFVHPLVGYRQSGPLPLWINWLDADLLPWLADHAIEGVPVLPAAAVLEMALAAARTRRPEADALEVADVELRRPLPFDAGRGRELRTRLDPDDGEWELNSRPRLSEEAPTVHAVARVVTATGADFRAPGLPSAAPVGTVEAAALYDLATRLGLDYGARFRTVARIDLIAAGEAVVHLDPAPIGEPLELYLVHPALLDGALQGLLALLADDQPELRGISFLPWRFGRVRLTAPFARVPRTAHLRVTRLGTRSAAADITLFDASGDPIAELSECWFRRVELSRAGSLDDRVLRVDAVPAPLEPAAFPPAFAGLGEALSGLAVAGDGPENETEQALLLDALSAAVAWRAVAATAGMTDGFTVEGLAAAGRIAAGSAPLLDTLLGLLARFGAARDDGDVWHLVQPNDLPEIGEVWRLLLAEAPTLVPELAILAAAAEDLPRLFAEGPGDGEAVPSSGFDASLAASPVSAAGARFVGEALAHIAAQWPAARKLRILELGAGGLATRRILDELGRSGVALSYLATSPDPDEAARLAFTVAATTGAEARCWSPADGDEAPDGAPFDLVLSLNAAARLRLDPAALARLSGFLVPGGMLLAVEPEPNPLWDLACGRFAWWWQGLAGAGGSPLRSGDQWCGDLAAAGFAETGSRRITAGPWPSIALWARAPDAAAERVEQPPARPAIALVADGPCEMIAAIGRSLTGLGHHPVIVAPGDLGELEGGHLAVVVVNEPDDPAEGAAQAMPLVSRAAAAAAQRRLPLWVVTAGAQQAEPGGRAGLAGAAVWGLGRVLVNEMPGLDLHLVDLPGSAGAAERARCLAAEFEAGSAENEIVWTASGRHVLRLRRGLPPRRPPAGAAIALASDGGGLDGLGWVEIAPRPPGPGEIEIDVHAAGLNFRDVMWGMGLLPEEALIDGFAGPTFGLECAGTVRAVGPDVAGIAVGDRVAGLAPASLSTRVTTAANAVTPIPPEIDFAAAATVPVAFVTVIYALRTLARLLPGEHVLIHAAAGGVGLAAIQYAKQCGAVVIATAGSSVKRAFLRQAGADHVIDSRDLGFADAVRAITGGAGVDVVLNSLSGEAMDNSIAVLKPFGRFLELGKRDFYLNRRIHLRPLRQNISYFAIDVDQLPMQRPDLARSLLGEVAEALASEAIRPLAHRVFRFGEIDEAFRLMQASGHIGKIVLIPEDGAGVRLSRPPGLTLRGDGVYLVTGGLNGFGFEAARWLVRCGAQRIALLGRRGADTPAAAARVAELTAAGAEVSVHAGDVADRASLAAVLARVRCHGALRGVVHAASAISDGLAIDIDAEAAAPMLRPKLVGAVLLDELTRDDPLDLFVLFSSATTLLGAPGQGVYVAANLALEALARQRRADGRPALAVGWGPIADAGYLADRPETRDALARRLGARPMPAAQALAALSALTAGGLSSAAFAETSWSEARRYLPILATSLFAEIRAEAESAPSDDSLIEKLASLDADGVIELLKTVVTEEAANILRLPAAGIEPQRPLSELGMDSLMAVELRLALETRLRIDLPLVSLAEGTSVASIAGRLAGAVSARPRISELQGLAARYEVAEDAGMASLLGDSGDMFDAAEEQSAAAE
ncbi:MAG TPA: SDR family NAD(P)-dependent oxidoreductase [Stellaceae bacterium]|nr:SDR family NAD(P)-dependent oxidoreductase [Stellaceae bacterium]